MSEITNAAYQLIRDFVQEKFAYVDIFDVLGIRILRMSVTDSRINWVHQAGSQRLEMMIILDGSNTDLPLPCRINKVALFETAESVAPLAEEGFSAFELAYESDLLIIRVQIEVPDII